MKGADVTDAQLAHAQDFLRSAAGGKFDPEFMETQKYVTVDKEDIIRLLAWFRKLYQRIDELEKSLAESRKHCVAWADQVSRAEGDRDIAPALSALNAIHRVDIVNLLAQYDAVIEGRTEVGEEDYEPDPEDAAVVEDIRVRWTGSVL